MGAFADTFNCEISDSHIGDMIADANDVKELQKRMEADGLKPGKLIANGSQALVFEIPGIQTGLLRIDGKLDENVPLDDPQVLKPVIRKEYGEFVVSVVPKGVNCGQLNGDDFFKTVAILKAKGKTDHFKDASPGQLSNIEISPGKLLKYPDGTPVAFIHDVNATTMTPDKLPNAFGTIEVVMEESFPGKKLPQVSEADIAAPQLQAMATERLRKELETIDLAPDLKKQLTRRSEWEKSAVARISHYCAESTIGRTPPLY